MAVNAWRVLGHLKRVLQHVVIYFVRQKKFSILLQHVVTHTQIYIFQIFMKCKIKSLHPHTGNVQGRGTIHGINLL